MSSPRHIHILQLAVNLNYELDVIMRILREKLADEFGLV